MGRRQAGIGEGSGTKLSICCQNQQRNFHVCRDFRGGGRVPKSRESSKKSPGTGDHAEFAPVAPFDSHRYFGRSVVICEALRARRGEPSPENSVRRDCGCSSPLTVVAPVPSAARLDGEHVAGGRITRGVFARDRRRSGDSSRAASYHSPACPRPRKHLLTSPPVPLETCRRA
jgi:hypothetical protein